MSVQAGKRFPSHTRHSRKLIIVKTFLFTSADYELILTISRALGLYMYLFSFLFLHRLLPLSLLISQGGKRVERLGEREGGGER